MSAFHKYSAELINISNSAKIIGDCKNGPNPNSSPKQFPLVLNPYIWAFRSGPKSTKTPCPGISINLTLQKMRTESQVRRKLPRGSKSESPEMQKKRERRRPKVSSDSGAKRYRNLIIRNATPILFFIVSIAISVILHRIIYYMRTSDQPYVYSRHLVSSDIYYRQVLDVRLINSPSIKLVSLLILLFPLIFYFFLLVPVSAYA